MEHGLTIVAPCWKLADELAVAFCDRHPRTRCVIVSERDLSLPDNGSTVICELPRFSFAKCVNRGIRSVGDGVILACGVDFLFTDAALTEAAGASDGKPVTFRIKRVEAFGAPPADFLYIGGCFAATWNDWQRLRGYAEWCEGWGYEDLDVATRCSRMMDMRISEALVYDADHDPNRGKWNGWTRDDVTNFHNGVKCRGDAWHWTKASERWGCS